MRNEQSNNSILKKLAAFFRHASGVTLSLGSSSVVLTITTAVALVAMASTAWIAINKNVDSGSAAMQVDDTLFELSVPFVSNNGVVSKKEQSHE